MPPLHGLFHAALGLLLVGGATKLIRPSSARDAIVSASAASVGRPVAGAAARVLGLVEVGAAVAALLAPDWRSLGLVAGLYLGFNAFLLRLRRVDASASCGCLGPSSVSAGPAHYLVNAVAAAVCGWTAMVDLAPGLFGSGFGTGLRPVEVVAALGGWAGAAPYAVAVALLTWLLAAGPVLWQAVQVETVVGEAR